MRIKLQKFLTDTLSYAIPVMMAGNFVIFSSASFNLYFNLFLVAGFILLFCLTRLVVPKLLVNNSFNLVLGLMFYFIIYNILHLSFTSSLIYSIIFTLFCTIILISLQLKLEEKKIYNMIVTGTVLSIIRIALETQSSLFVVDIHSRYDAGFIGGINNFAYIVTSAVIITYYEIKPKVLKVLLMLFLIAFNLLTLSRGANLIMAVFFLWLLFSSINFKKIIVVTGIVLLMAKIFSTYTDSVLLERYNLYSEAGGGGDNRSAIWKYAFSKMDSWDTFYWGNGVGRFQMPVYDKILISTHNQYVDFLYNFGIIGGSIFFLVFTLYSFSFFKLYKINPTLFWLNIIYVFSFLLDTRLWVIQTFWLYAVIIGLTLQENKNKFVLYGR